MVSKLFNVSNGVSVADSSIVRMSNYDRMSVKGHNSRTRVLTT